MVWEFGRNQNLRGAIVCNTHGQAVKVLGAVAEHIASNPAVREVFPDLQPGSPWRGASINLANRNVGLKDYSLQAVGVHGSILGARLDWIVLDDVSDYENTRTPAGRDDLVAWFRSTVLGRLTDDATCVLIGTSWHPEDLPHVLSRQGWATITDQAIDPATWDPASILWPEAWPLARLQAKKLELGSWEFGRQFLNEVYDDATSRFRRGWIEAALARGEGGMVQDLASSAAQARFPEGTPTFCGVDLAVSERPDADRTAFVAVAVMPDRHRVVLSVESGHWQAPEILARIGDHDRRYRHPIVFVENNAAQDFICQMARHMTSALVPPHTTGRGKASLQFEAEKLAVEMEQGMWTFPSVNGRAACSEIEGLVEDLLAYSPDKHVGDRLAALLFVRAHADESFGPVQTIPCFLFAR
jgi:hypothetical protein